MWAVVAALVLIAIAAVALLPRLVDGPAPDDTDVDADAAKEDPLAPDPERLAAAEEDYQVGATYLQQHRIADENLSIAIEQFTRAEATLAALSLTDPPQWAAEVSASRDEAEELLDQKYRSTKRQYVRYYQSGDYAEAMDELARIVRLVPDEDDPRNEYARTRRTKVTQLMAERRRDTTPEPTPQPATPAPTPLEAPDPWRPEPTPARTGSGGPSVFVIDTIIRNNSAIVRCQRVEQAKVDLPGKIYLKFTIAPDGTVSKARVTTSRFAGTALDTCISRELNGLKFPPFDGSAKKITYPLITQEKPVPLAVEPEPTPESAGPSAFVIDTMIRNNSSIVRCLRVEQAKGVDLSGKIYLKFTIAPDGTVSKARVTTARFARTALDTCISRELNGLKFPPFDGSEKKITYPLIAQLERVPPVEPEPTPESTRSEPTPESTRSDGPSAFVIDTVIRNNASIVRCLRVEEAKGVDLSGKIYLKFTIAPDGTVSKARVTTARFAGTPLDTCTSRELNGLKFPPFDGSEKKITYPLIVQ